MYGRIKFIIIDFTTVLIVGRADQPLHAVSNLVKFMYLFITRSPYPNVEFLFNNLITIIGALRQKVQVKQIDKNILKTMRNMHAHGVTTSLHMTASRTIIRNCF